MAKSYDEVIARFDDIEFRDEFDMIVAIANGGIIPAAIINQKLNLDMQLLKLSLRDAAQKQMYDSPKLLEPVRFEVKGKRILLVEDRIKTGLTVNYARQLLRDMGAAEVKTFAVNGSADYFLYNETCFRFPWIR